MKDINIETIYAGILGVAVGDAVGVPYEFLKTEDMKKRPATDMTSGGIHGQPKGFWSDDTSMTLAMMDAMSTWEDKEDYDAVMKTFPRGITTVSTPLTMMYLTAVLPAAMRYITIKSLIKDRMNVE